MAEPWCPDNVPPPSDIDAARVQAAERIDYLCERGWTPLLLTGFFRDFLVTQWTTESNIVNPVLHKHIWKESADSGILIESVTRFRADLVEKRPAVMIKRNSIKIQPVGIGTGRAFGDLSNGGQLTQRGAFETHSVLFSGSHTLFCIGGQGMAETLAIEVLTHVMELCPVVQYELALHACLPAEMGAVQKLAGTSDNLVVPITIVWQYDHSWRLYEESHPLQRVDLNPQFMPDGSLRLSGQPKLI